MKKICVSNIKGGVAKTTTAVNLATLMAMDGHRTLLIDLDPQGNTSKQFELYDIESKSISDVLLHDEISIKEVARKTSITNLNVLPSNLGLVEANMAIAINCLRPQQYLLKKKLDEAKDDYDFVVIDCGPNLDLITLNGLVATDAVIVPIKIDQFGLDGLEYLIKQINELKKSFNPNLRFDGVLVTMNKNNKLDRDFIESLSKAKIKKYETTIRETVKVREATFHCPVVVYDQYCTASVDYKKFYREFKGEMTQ